MQYKGIELKEITEPQIFNPPKEMLVWDECDEGEILNDNYEPKRVKVYGIIATTGARVVALFNGDLAHFEKCAEIPEEPKPRRATNRELAKWLAQVNGEMTFKSKSESDIDHLVFTSHLYEEEFADEECDKALKRADDGSWIVVRKWDDTEWHEPTADYLGIE